MERTPGEYRTRTASLDATKAVEEESALLNRVGEDGIDSPGRILGASTLPGSIHDQSRACIRSQMNSINRRRSPATAITRA